MPWLSLPRFLAYRQIFQQTLGFDPHQASVMELATCAQQQGINLEGELNAQGWRDLLLTHCVEPRFPSDQLTFIYHYPAAQCALAKVQELDGYRVAERFEVYLGALELGNGYQEQTDASQNRHILQQDAQTRGDSIPVDKQFLAALEQGLPECAGVALGVDRILMCRMQVDDLKQVISFPWEVA